MSTNQLAPVDASAVVSAVAPSGDERSTISPEAFFVGRGWHDYGWTPSVHGTLYGRRIEGTPCALNERLSIHATHYSSVIHDRQHDSIEFEITAEADNGQWFALKAYSVSLADLTDETVDDIVRRLRAAWEACAKGRT